MSTTNKNKQTDFLAVAMAARARGFAVPLRDKRPFLHAHMEQAPANERDRNSDGSEGLSDLRRRVGYEA